MRTHIIPEIMSSRHSVLGRISGEWCDGKNVGLRVKGQSSGLGDDFPTAHL